MVLALAGAVLMAEISPLGFCPMPKTAGAHRLTKGWRTPQKIRHADLGYREGLSCYLCHQTWTTWRDGRAVDPEPAYPKVAVIFR